MNSCRDGTWDTEEIIAGAPFARRKDFQLFFLINREKYEVHGDAGGAPRKIKFLVSPSAKVQCRYLHLTENKGAKAATATGALRRTALSLKRFIINLKTGPDDGDDIAFHYNISIGKFTTLNSFRNGRYEKEEKIPYTPFTEGQAFTILVVNSSTGYEVFVDGVKHCTFTHRIPSDKVFTVDVRGDVSLFLWGIIYQVLPHATKLPGESHQNKAIFIQGMVPVNATGFTVNLKTGPANTDDIAFQYNPCIGKFTSLNSFRNGTFETQEAVSDKPFTMGEAFQMIVAINSEGYETFPLSFNIPGGIKKNMAVFCQGSVSSDAKSFTFDFKAGNDIAFHYKPNIGSYTSMNSLKNNVWGAEQRLSKNTFNKGEAFQIIIVINPEAIEIYVNGSKQCVFKHRIPMEKVTALEIHGDLSKLLYGVIYALPYVGKIPSGLKDLVVIFQGSVPQKAKRFVITFKTGSSAGDDIAFNYNPCIGNNTTMNSCRNGTWDSEEITAGAPFAREKEFQLFFLINREKYEV
ncbi:Galectin-6 [Bagarius yarrelli]|uniref:Galectin n=1 Tax=Bagarius yarrelli TaxID=175774 RepID=A0A556U160_BAGYA|nr:Galectin-6 [Bagarius yarrelli]